MKCLCCKTRGLSLCPLASERLANLMSSGQIVTGRAIRTALNRKRNSRELAQKVQGLAKSIGALPLKPIPWRDPETTFALTPEENRSLASLRRELKNVCLLNYKQLLKAAAAFTQEKGGLHV